MCFITIYQYFLQGMHDDMIKRLILKTFCQWKFDFQVGHQANLLA